MSGQNYYLGLLYVPPGSTSGGGWTETWPVNWPMPRDDGRGGAVSPDIPGYCPPGTYHPSWDPYSCVPFPDSTAGQGGGAPAVPRRTTSSSQPAVRRTQAPVICPPGQIWDSTQQRCIAGSKDLSGVPWWVWLVVGGAILIAVKGR
jgi:hypothetical protein